MRSCDENRYDRAPRFYPPLVGCVAKDMALCRMLCGLWADTFSSFRYSLEGSLFLLPLDRTLADVLYRDCADLMEELRILGELIIALGAQSLPEPCGGRKRRCRTAQDFFACSVKDKMRRIDLYETLMSRTGDRVVRSVIAGLISTQRRACRQLEGSFKADEKNQNNG